MWKKSSRSNLRTLPNEKVVKKNANDAIDMINATNVD